MKYTIPYVKIRDGAKPPAKAHIDDAGWDLSVSLIKLDNQNENYITFGCGLAFDFSNVGFAQAMARSSVWKHHMVLTNGAGIIDAGYRGEVMGVFYTLDDKAILYKPDERFMQLVFPQLRPDDVVEFIEVDKLEPSSRGDGGYGSTGDK